MHAHVGKYDCDVIFDHHGANKALPRWGMFVCGRLNLSHLRYWSSQEDGALLSILPYGSLFWFI